MKSLPMKATLAALASVVTLLAGAATVSAHHSFAAEFDGSKPIRLVGTITKVQWTNPHSFFYIDVKDEGGNVVNWACEGGGPGALSRRGWKRGDLKLGDTLVVDGYLARDGSHLMDARRVTLPDGRRCTAARRATAGRAAGWKTKRRKLPRRSDVSSAVALHVAERDSLSQRRQRIARRHELVREISGESGIRDRAADRAPVQFLRVVELVASRHAAGVVVRDVDRCSRIVRMTSPSMICMW